jgi:hypothetical protein
MRHPLLRRIGFRSMCREADVGSPEMGLVVVGRTFRHEADLVVEWVFWVFSIAKSWILACAIVIFFSLIKRGRVMWSGRETSDVWGSAPAFRRLRSAPPFTNIHTRLPSSGESLIVYAILTSRFDLQFTYCFISNPGSNWSQASTSVPFLFSKNTTNIRGEYEINFQIPRNGSNNKSLTSKNDDKYIGA